MHPHEVIKYCPLCKCDLIKQDINILVCGICSYNYFISPTPCNAAIIENDKGEILLVERKNEPQKGLWDLPGGFIDGAETLAASVKRELKEELGVDSHMNKIIGVYPDTYLYQNIIHPTLSIVISVKVLIADFKPADDVSSFKFFTRHEALHQTLAFGSIYEGLKDYFEQKNLS